MKHSVHNSSTGYTMYITTKLCHPGCGISFASMSSNLLIQEHFDKHRSFATSFAACGLPLGYITSPFIINALLEKFGWRGCLMIHSGIMMHTIVLAMTFWPVKVQKTKKVTPGIINFCKSFMSSFLVLKRKPVIFLVCSIAFMKFNIATFYDHSPSRLVFLGFSLIYAGYMITAMGAATLIGRVLCTIILGLDILEPVFAFGLALFTESTCQFISAVLTLFVPLVAISTVYGFAQGKMGCIIF